MMQMTVLPPLAPAPLPPPLPQTKTQVMLAIQPMESPFAWKLDRYSVTKYIKFFPDGVNLTISFTATRISKVFGYIPVIGTFVGISRIYRAFQEYHLFNQIHLHSLSQRSLKWMGRGILESVPVLGGLTCIITDIVATILNKSRSDHPIQLEDETDCGECHQCGKCSGAC